MEQYQPVDGDPFAASAVSLQPVFGDPFTAGAVTPESQGQAQGFVNDFANKASQTWPVRMAQGAYTAAMAPGDYMQGKISDEEAQQQAFNLAGLAMTGGVISGVERGAGEAVLGSGPIRNKGPIQAYHATDMPFESFDYSKLGQNTAQNVNDPEPGSWAMNLAQLGPWASEKPLSSTTAQAMDLPVNIGGAGKQFGSLDQLEAAVRKAGGPDQFRQQMLGKGFGHVAINDEEFGGKSYVALAPEHFQVGAPPSPFAGANTSLQPVTGDPFTPITAYHGSPHDFDAFDISKIGTGEGAQAYGHGLYFAGNEKVAQQYRDNLSTYKSIQDYNNNNPANRPGQVANMLASQVDGDNINAALQVLEPNSTQEMRDQWKREGQQLYEKFGHDGGGMYQVQINADPNHFLDWDKPLSEQHPVVQQALGLDKLPQKPTPEEGQALFALAKQRGVPANTMPEYQALEARLDNAHKQAWDQLGIPPQEGMAPTDITGSMLYRGWDNPSTAAMHSIQDTWGLEPAQKLKQAGIPGIKYLDAGSRGAAPLQIPPEVQAMPPSSVNAVMRHVTDTTKAPLDAARDAQGAAPALQNSDPQHLADLISQMRQSKQQANPTHNYVVFDHNIIDILKKYGIGGLGIGTAAGLKHFQTQPVNGDPYQ